MGYNGKILADARTELEEIKQRNIDEHDRRVRHTYAIAPEIEEIDRRLYSQWRDIVKLVAAHSDSIPERVNILKNENTDLRMRRAECLTEHGLPIDYLDDIYSCEICKDTGNTGSGICDCLKKIYNRRLSKELSSLIRTGDECFDNFRLDVYSDAVTGDAKRNDRDRMTIVYNACKKFADNFPEVGRNLLLRGGPGLGKTYLSACIAKVVTEKGYSVYYDSASSAFSAFENEKFSRIPEVQEQAAEKVMRMLDVDLLILDDLGTEVITQPSISALYTLINTRLNNNRRMVISTNLSTEDFSRKYSPAICSRLEGEFLLLPFVGSDFRLANR